MNRNKEENNTAWHSLENNEILSILKSNTSNGLTPAEVKKRLIKFGLNVIPKAKRRSLLTMFLHQFLSPLIYLLLLAVAVAFYIGESRDALVICIVVLVNAVIGAIQEGRAEKSLESLLNLSKLSACVLRDGIEKIIEASKVVPGDIIIIRSGDAIAADAKLLEISSLAVAEAALTGESLPVLKSLHRLNSNTPLTDRINMVFAGTHITAGRAKAIVINTGLNNEIGKIANLVSNTKEIKTQLQIRIAQFGKHLIVVALLVFGLVIGIGLLRDFSFSYIFMISIGQMVSLVPEGLPVAITIALAVGVQRMAKQGTIVRRLTAVENLGSTTIICTDKTGTLTRNEMTVTNLYLPIGKREIIISGVGYSPEGNFIESGEKINPNNDKTLLQLFTACILCNDAHLIPPDKSDSRWKIIGDPTEGALLTLAAKAGIDPNIFNKNYHRKAELPFNSDIKMMATQHEMDKENIVFIKGAPEKLLDLCDFVFHNGEIQSFDNKTKLEVHSMANKMASQALRILALGFIKESFIDDTLKFTPFNGKVIFLGLVGEVDPPREQVAEAIKECIKAGIRPVLVTGDHKVTGETLARNLGIYQENDLALNGIELDILSEKELLEKIDRISVFTRVHPVQKLRIVEAFQKKGNIVTMTGDGVNDAPALARANVGVAMGITGTEVAKESAQIIITDDNFATIIKAVAEGRLVYQNIKKLILFLFVTSIDEVIILFLALILGFPPPLAAVQILWINLVTEGTLALNLIMEPPEGDEMKQTPIPPDQPLIDRPLLLRIPLMVTTSVIVTFGWFIYRINSEINPALVQTETFTILAICQWFNALNCRSNIHSVFSWSLIKNPWLITGLLIANIMQIAVIYWQPLNLFFHTVPIGISQIFIIGAVASSVLWTEEIRKFIARKKVV